MTIRSLTVSLTAVAIVTAFGVGCAKLTSPSSSSTAYTPAAGSMGNAAVGPDNTPSTTGRGAATLDSLLNSHTPSPGNASVTMSGSGDMVRSGSTGSTGAGPQQAPRLALPAGAVTAVVPLAAQPWWWPAGTPAAQPASAHPSPAQSSRAQSSSAHLPLVAAQPAAPARRADFAGVAAPSADARRLADWVAASGDNGPRDFVIVDKRAARVYVFDRQARLQADTPALLGSARGDHTVPGIGERPIALVQPHERTTPAGRFIAEPGVNTQGEDVVWVDYDAAVSMHRVRTGKPAEQRLARLASPGVDDNRISYGCINLPVQFYETQLRPRVHGGPGAVIYVLPEVLALQQVFALPPLAIPPG